MKKNLYYRDVIKRDNILKQLFLALFSIVTSYPRLLLEVFTREKFGSRYFKLSAAISLAIPLALLPFMKRSLFGFKFDTPAMTLDNVLWYGFLVCFLMVCVKHHRYSRRETAAFDFNKYSLSSGHFNKHFLKVLKMSNRNYTPRSVETLLEPGLFFILGLLLCILQVKLGVLLVICSVLYSLSYVAAYNSGDNFLLDKIDEIIANRNLEKIFIDDVPKSDADEFEARFSRRPTDGNLRRRAVEFMFEEEEAADAK